jgi:hypothetical protein
MYILRCMEPERRFRKLLHSQCKRSLNTNLHQIRSYINITFYTVKWNQQALDKIFWRWEPPCWRRTSRLITCRSCRFVSVQYHVKCSLIQVPAERHLIFRKHYGRCWTANINHRYRQEKSPDSSVGIALGYGLDGRGSRVRSPTGLGIFLFTTASKTALGPTQPPIQWVPGALSLGIERPGREADHSPPSSAEVKEWVELYLHSYNTPSWRGAQLKHRDNFTFTFCRQEICLIKCGVLIFLQKNMLTFDKEGK